MTSSDTIPGKTCVNCGNPIPWRPGIKVRKRAAYCSEICRCAKTEFIPGKRCLHCRGPIPWLEGAAVRHRAKFCGNACKFAYQKQHPPHPRKPRETKPCAACGKPVEYLPSQRGAMRKNPRFAKKLTPEIISECRRRYEAKEATMTALAAEFGVSVSSVSIAIRQAAYGDNVYCDAACRNAGHSKIMTGRRPSNGVYASSSTFRVMIRREFTDRCAICSWAEAPCDVAHIVARKSGGTDDLENVVMLCPNHHRLFDLGLIPEDMVRAARVNCLAHP